MDTPGSFKQGMKGNVFQGGTLFNGGFSGGSFTNRRSLAGRGNSLGKERKRQQQNKNQDS
jgi:hypothetical protein